MKFRSITMRLRSVRTSAYLIGAMLAIFLLGQVVPQKRLLTPQDIAAWQLANPTLYRLLDSLGMLQIYTSPLALLVLIIFFLNLLLVFQSRLSAVWRKCALEVFDPLSTDRTYVIDVHGEGKAEVMERLKKLFRGQKFHADGNMFLSVRNRVGPLGSMLFHLSFVLLFAGGLMLYYTRGTGTAYVAEGQSFSGSREAFQSLRPSILGGVPGLALRVVDITPVYVKGKPVDLRVSVEVPSESAFDGAERIRVNHPLVRGSTSVLIRRIDVAPVIRLEDISGEQLYEYAAVVLHVLEDRVDSYQVPFTPFSINFEFYPDFAEEDGLASSRSTELKNPVFRVSVRDRERELFNGFMRPGESREFSGLRLGIEDILYWGDFLMVRERGGMLLWAGFLLGIAGLCWRFFFFRTEIRGEFTKDSILVFFRSEQAWVFRERWIAESLSRIERAFPQEEH